MENLSVPDFMLSDAAAALAFLFLIASALSVLALALVDMKTERLTQAFREGVRAVRKQAMEPELDLEAGVAEPETKSRKKKGRRTRGNLSKILYFLIPDESADAGASDSPPYSLDDSAWLTPEKSLPEAAMGDAFELSDAVWQAPFVAV